MSRTTNIRLKLAGWIAWYIVIPLLPIGSKLNISKTEEETET